MVRTVQKITMLMVGVSILFGASCAERFEIKSFVGWYSFVHLSDDSRSRLNYKIHLDDIINDLIRTWDTIITEDQAHFMGIDKEEVNSNSAIGELRRLKMVGAWREGESFVISLQVHPRILPDYLGPYNFDYFVRRYETLLKSAETEKKMERVQSCLYRGIDLFLIN